MIFLLCRHSDCHLSAKEFYIINQHNGDWETILLLRYCIARTISAAVKVSHHETPAIHVVQRIAGSFGVQIQSRR